MTCTIDGCERPHLARGWCHPHYERWRKTGDAQAARPLGAKRDVGERFWVKVAKQPGEGCWLWTGALIGAGYGQFAAPGPSPLAHRWAWEQEHGPVPEGLELDHLCHAPACVRPSHLEAVTHTENMRRSAPAQKPDCPRGHPLSGENLYLNSRGRRECRTCRRAAHRRYDRAHYPRTQRDRP